MYVGDGTLEKLERRAGWMRERVGPLVSAAAIPFAPVIHGIDTIPTRGPVFFVANHTVMGVVDSAVLVAELWRRKGLEVWSLGAGFHFQVPIWRDLLSAGGVVHGTRENCAALMRTGKHILVFPGGGREVCKRKGEKYQLMWKDRLGFVRLAIEHSVPIVAVSAVGGEELFDIVVDGGEIRRSPLGGLVDRANRRMNVPADEIMPIVRGIGPTVLPRPTRLYFKFGTPIDVSGFAGCHDDDDACRTLRDRVKAVVEAGIAELRAEQDGASRPKRGAA